MKNKSSDLKLDFSAFENYPEMSFVLSKDGVILKYNLVTKEKLNIDDNHAENKSIFNFIPESYQKTFRDALNNIVERKYSEVSVTFNGKNDTAGQSLTCSFFKVHDDGKVFVITKTNSSTDELEIKLKRFYTIAEKSANPIQITDNNGKMVYVNPAFLKISGYTEQELIGANPNIFGSKKHSKSFWEQVWNTIKSGNVWSGEIEDRKKSGEPFYSHAVISPIIDDEGVITGYFAIHNDIREKKMLEKQLIHSQKMESIGILAAGIAHEVGNPLSSISALAQVVARKTQESFVKEKLELINSQVKRISKTIRDLVDFSRPSEYIFKSVDINRHLEQAVEITKAGVKTKKIEFILNLNKEIPLINLVPDQIDQVFINILLNAIDAINENEKRNNKIVIDSSKINNKLVVSIEDSGIGIDDEVIPKIFEPFFTTKEQGKGTGLGLWISYGIVTSFQGEIKVESAKGEGTKFIIILPLN